MRGALIAALPCVGLHALAGDDSWCARMSERGVELGAGAVAEFLRATEARNWPARLDLSASIEADLGEFTGWSLLDHWYVFALPTLAWGEEEDWRWRAPLYQAWLKWDGSEKWNILAGRYDPTWDVHSLPSSAPFVRLPSRVGGEFSPGSPGLLDLYPLAAPGVRLEFKPTRHLAIQTAGLVLGDEYELHGRAVGGRRGLFNAEIAWRTADEEAEKRGHFHTRLGGWRLPAQTSWGLYAFADAALWREPGSKEQGCSAFASASIAGARGRDLDRRFVGGLNWHGLIPRRDYDVTALALIHETLGDEPGNRTAWELLHRVPLSETNWLQFRARTTGAPDSRSAGNPDGCCNEPDTVRDLDCEQCGWKMQAKYSSP